MDNFDPNNFDYNELVQFMRSLGASVYVYDTDDPTRKELDRLDVLEVDVATRPCYNSVQEMIDNIKEM